jgi:hypothetical protein
VRQKSVENARYALVTSRTTEQRSTFVLQINILFIKKGERAKVANEKKRKYENWRGSYDGASAL